MTLDPKSLRALADRLEKCQREALETNKITDEHPEMDWEDAYAVQAELLARKLARGDRLIGLKAGLTSMAKMKQMGVDSPVFGFLTDDYAVAQDAEVPMAGLIHPRVEPEIAFVMRKPLRGPGCHVAAVLESTDFVMPGLEVIDSRYKDFKFDLKSVVADNTSAARFCVGGTPARPMGLDLRTLGVVLEKNGEPVAFGAGAAVLGHPATAIAMLANHLGRRGQEIPAGSIILSGAITEAIAVQAGDHVRVSVQGLGSTGIRFK